MCILYSFLYTITARKANTLYSSSTCTAQSLLYFLFLLLFSVSLLMHVSKYTQAIIALYQAIPEFFVCIIYNNKISRNLVSCCWFFAQVEIFKFLFKPGHFSIGIFASIFCYVVTDRCCQSSSHSYFSVDQQCRAGLFSLCITYEMILVYPVPGVYIPFFFLPPIQLRDANAHAVMSIRAIDSCNNSSSLLCIPHVNIE